MLPETDNAQDDVTLLSRFPGMGAQTQVFFRAGALVVCVKDDHDSSAGDSNTYCAVPLEKIRDLLTPLGRAVAEASLGVGGKS